MISKSFLAIELEQQVGFPPDHNIILAPNIITIVII